MCYSPEVNVIIIQGFLITLFDNCLLVLAKYLLLTSHLFVFENDLWQSKHEKKANFIKKNYKEKNRKLRLKKVYSELPGIQVKINKNRFNLT